MCSRLVALESRRSVLIGTIAVLALVASHAVVGCRPRERAARGALASSTRSLEPLGAWMLDAPWDLPRSPEDTTRQLLSDQDVLCVADAIRLRCTHALGLEQLLSTGRTQWTVTTDRVLEARCVGEWPLCAQVRELQRRYPLPSGPIDESVLLAMQRSEEERGHHCSASDGDVRCHGENLYGQCASPQRQDVAPERALAIAGARADTLSLGAASTCIADERDAVWCWGAFGHPDRNRLPPRELRQFEPFRLGAHRALRALATTRCGVCAASSDRMRCWFSSSDTISRATATRERSIPTNATLLHSFFDDSICIAQSASIRCGALGGYGGCDRTLPDWMRLPVVALPAHRGAALIASGYVCVLAADDQLLRCADIVEIRRGEPVQWRAMKL